MVHYQFDFTHKKSEHKERTEPTPGGAMGISAHTDTFNFDKRVIAYWELHRTLPPFIRDKDRGLLKELLDAIPDTMHELRKQIELSMP